MSTHRTLYLSLAVLALAACSTDVTGPGSTPSVDAATAADAQGTVDAAPILVVNLSPQELTLAVGAEAALQAEVRTENDDVVANAELNWQSAAPAIATVDEDGAVTGVAKGQTQISVSAGGATASAMVTVTDALDPYACCLAGIDNLCDLPPSTEGCPMTFPGGYCDPDGDGDFDASGNAAGAAEYASACTEPVDYQTCCAGNIDNFCNLAPNTAGCPMTYPGGYCDPNGDSSYAELSTDDWVFGYNQYQEHCEDIAQECPSGQGNNGDSCANVHQGADIWRCTVSPVLGNATVSQVCRDIGNGPRWYTFHINPTECCACDGDFDAGCCAANSGSAGCP